MTNRRDLLLTGAALVGVAAGWQAWIRRPQPFEFVDLPGLPGWQLLESGPLTRPGGDAFLTLGQDGRSADPIPPDALDAVLYRTRAEPRIAVFSDFFCPFCRVLTSRLAARPDINISWHELPLLGPPSEFAARALVAADLQGAYAPFTEALAQRGFRPSVAYMGQIADGIGIDGARLSRDMAGADVAARLKESRRAADTLGIYGTPGLTVGRILVIGEISRPDFDRLIAMPTA